MLKVKENISSIKKEWFYEWFDSPYYHILYKDRNDEEARFFIDRLCSQLQIKSQEKALDMPCGKGRHSVYLNEKGLDVVGIDLSEQNIDFAKKFENESLEFHVHDMRKPFATQEFDYVLNIFTSFGYFDTETENQDVICSGAQALKKGGIMLLDFLNPYTVVPRLVANELREVGGIKFNISRKFTDTGYICKEIRFRHKDMDFNFHEKVKAIKPQTFLGYFKTAGLDLMKIFGNYCLEDFVPNKSERMIFLLKK
jgi:SAM-dependent methyltransferase